MFASFPIFLLWAQAQGAAPEAAKAVGAAATKVAAAAAVAPPVSPLAVRILKWLFVLGEPNVTVAGAIGPLMTWLKVLGLFCLLAWLVGWVVGAIRERIGIKGDWLDYAALSSLFLGVLAALLNVLQDTKRIPTFTVGPLTLTSLLVILLGVTLVVWVERILWRVVRKIGTPTDFTVLYGLHVALGLGIAVAFLLRSLNNDVITTWTVAASYGTRLGATYMGFVVLAKVVWMLIPEVTGMRARRLYAIARHAVVESTRRMQAPWVVITVFLVILAFTHWFLQAPSTRPAEIGRLYVGTLSLLCSLLLTVMVTILSPISLPQDIQFQTIYTIVTKPVRRIELIWGRILGYMAIVTVLVIAFGGISLVYLWRNVGAAIVATEKQALDLQTSDPARSKLLADQAEQLRSRMSARVPVKGSLTFLDSRGTPQLKGIDVGQELEFRSHIEGATPATAIWRYGVLPDPLDPTIILDRRIPVRSLLQPGTIEWLENEAAELDASNGDKATADGYRAESRKLQAQAADFEAKAEAADKAGQAGEADNFRMEAARLHSAPVPIEMNFTIYRTTKGKVGEAVYAQITATNEKASVAKWSNTFPIREYYTNKQFMPASYLVGSQGAMTFEIRCATATQYMGMAESDFYILAKSDNFGMNFMRGLFGIWLQAMVLTAIGVFAGSFLSWPVALLTTIAFFIGGNVAVAILKDIFLQSLIGGGPFESLIRLVTHDNQMSDLNPTLSVVVAKVLDSLVMPVLSRLVYVIPNLNALDVTNTVAEGYAVEWSTVWQNTLLALAYALPFSIAGYFILKNREVAA